MGADARNKILISGGTFDRSAIGIGSVQQHTVGGGGQPTVGDLLSELRELREEIVALGRDERERAVLARGVDQVHDELAEPQPDGDIVRGGWKSVLKVLDGGARAAESITKITELIGSLFGP